MRNLGVLVLALVLTLPIYLGITSIPWLADWFASGAGWDVFSPIFRMLGSRGGEQNESMLFAMLLLISFLLSLALAAWVSRVVMRYRRRRASP